MTKPLPYDSLIPARRHSYHESHHRMNAPFRPLSDSLDFPRIYPSKIMAARLLCASLVLGMYTGAAAFELTDAVQVHGFATQGLFTSNGNNFIGPSAHSVSLQFTELGMNASWSPLPKLRFSIQGLSRRAGGIQDGSPVLDFGLMDYSFFDEADYRLGIRLGRVRLPYGLYNDTRDVAFTRPSVLLPQSIYPERTRNFTISGDGAGYYGEWRNPWGSLTLDFVTAFPRTDEEAVKVAIVGLTTPAGNLTPGSVSSDLSYIGRLAYDLDGGRLRLALTGAYVTTHYDPVFTWPYDYLAGNDQFFPWIISGQYNTEDWTFTSEYSLRPVKHSGFAPSAFARYIDENIIGEAYYFQMQYRFAPQWELVGRYDALYIDRNDPNGMRFQRLLGEIGYDYPAYNRYAQNWTVGIRYDVTAWMMLRAEYNYVNGGAWLPRQDNPDPAAVAKYWNEFSFEVSLRF